MSSLTGSSGTLGFVLAMTALMPGARHGALPAPDGVAVHFSDSAATIDWNAVSGSRGYLVIIRPLGMSGPFPEEQVLADSYTVDFVRFPVGGKAKSGYSYEVCSVAPSGALGCTTTASTFAVRSEGDGIRIDNLKKAAHKASACLAGGEKAGLVVAAGGGVVAAVSSWIPGAGEITAAEVAVAATGVGTRKFVACLLDDE